MNLKQLGNNLHHKVRLRPVPKAIDPKGHARNVDDFWIIGSVNGDKIELNNIRTGQVVRLNPDHVHSYTSDVARVGDVPAGFLELKVQVRLADADVSVEPLLSGAARLPTFHVRDRPPEPGEGKDGDFWFEINKDQS